MAEERLSDEPVDKLTRLTAVMTSALEADPEYNDNVRAIIMLDDGKRGGIQLHGYEDATAGIADLLAHLRAIFRANGKRMDIVFMDEDGMDTVGG